MLIRPRCNASSSDFVLPELMRSSVLSNDPGTWAFKLSPSGFNLDAALFLASATLKRSCGEVSAESVPTESTAADTGLTDN